jgi:hypothetical protein
MKTVDELNAKLAELQDAVKTDEEQDDANAAALQAVITELQAKVDGSTVDFSEQIDKLNEIMGLLHGPAGATEPGTGAVEPT